MPGSEEQSNRPRLLIVEPDAEMGAMMVEALGDRCESLRGCTAMPSQPHDGDCAASTDGADSGRCCVLLHSLQELHEFDLNNSELVICAVSLPDGSGLDAQAFVRGIRPELPVVLTGPPADADLAVEAIHAGAADFLVTSGVNLRTLPLVVEKCLVHHRMRQENERLQTDLSRSLAELELKNQQLRAVINQLESMARTDDLTGMSNRRWLNLMLEGSWAEATRSDLPLAFMMIDLDGFKALNDQCGHQRGDEMLRLAGKVIQASCRSVDTTARYGGDEFCVLMPHTEAAEAVQVAERIRGEFDLAMQRMPDDEPRIGMSIGVAQINLSQPVNADQLVTHADEALYAAKAAGKHRVMLREDDGITTTAEAA